MEQREGGGEEIRVAIVGVGNCASSLVQGIGKYKDTGPDERIPGLMNSYFGPYSVGSIKIVAAFDVNANKVGKDVSEAIFAEPNNTTVFHKPEPWGVIVKMGNLLDGINDFVRPFVPVSEERACRVVAELKRVQADIVINYLPVGSQKATEYYADCALQAGCGFVNCIPVFIASDPEWAQRFEQAGLPIVGDDIKAQMGATYTHRALVQAFMDRGMDVNRTYQLNTGGNTDVLNMREIARLDSKKTSKTEAVTSVLKAHGRDIAPENVHVGPSDYVPWQKDNKIAFIRIESMHFGDVPMHVEMRLSVEDSPNSAGVAIDAIRCCKIAMDRGEKGVVKAPSAFFMKHPPQQMLDHVAKALTAEYISS